MKKLLRALVALLVILLAVAAVYYMANNSPRPEKRSADSNQKQVKVQLKTLSAESVRLPIIAFATVEAGEQTKLVTEVNGRVSYIAPTFEDGLEFKKGDVLIRQQTSRLVAAHNIAKAEVARSQALLDEENARAQQASQNWRLTGNTKKPNPLVLREPQMAIAQANLDTANNRLRQASLDLAAATIKAPYSGITLNRAVNKSQFLNAGAMLGTIMAKDHHRLRVALSGNQIGQLDLSQKPARAEIISTIGNNSYSYTGIVVATSAQVDINTRQFEIILRVDKPFDYEQPLYPGQYVEVRLPGRVMENVYVIPLSMIDRNDRIALRVAGKLRRLPVTVLAIDGDNAIVTGLEPGSELITSAHSSIIEGTPVEPVVDQ